MGEPIQSLPESEHERRALARTLLIELLAYQFAFPVQWIDTQKQFFTRDEAVERYVEVGPAKVLSTMGKKTVARNHQLQDQLRLIRRQFLSHSDDYAQICYEYEESQPVATTEAQPAPAAPAPVAVAAAAPVAPVAAAPVAAAVAVDDVAVSALDIVLALSAQKLKQPFDQVPLQKCIRDLSGGKSTLQNELIGDLVAEFGGTPDGCEDLPLEAVGAALDGSFTGRPGKVIHLETHWGLGPQRQTAVLCYSVSLDPSARPAAASAGGGAAAGGAMIDSKELERLRTEQNDAFKQLHLALGKMLDSDGDELVQKLAHSEELWQEADQKLEAWQADYDAWWNWARVDIASLLLGPGSTSNEEKIWQVLNRSNPSAFDLVKYHIAHPLRHGDKQLQIQPLEQLFQGYRPRTTVSPKGVIEYEEIPRTIGGRPDKYVELLKRGSRFDAPSTDSLPFVRLCRPIGSGWKYHDALTSNYLDAVQAATSTGISFAGKTVLITGAGPQSIGAEITRGLLTAGANVIVTTSRSNMDFYRSLYRDFCGRGSSLTVFPFNQASRQDCQALISHLYNDTLGTAGDIDCVIPFAAISENGRQIDGLDGCIKQQKEARGYGANPTQVILPLSPNHGTFGGDGLYSESKIGLETLFNRFKSESWGDYLTVCGAVIGWTRGTGLMSANNIVAEAIEAEDVITFSSAEMALNIMALMTPAIAEACEDAPVYADLGGKMEQLADLKGLSTAARKQVQHQARARKAIAAEDELHERLLKGPEEPKQPTTAPTTRKPRANLTVGHPDLPDYQAMTAGIQLPGREMIDLNKTIVVVGYSELGPWGSARTRWDMERTGDLSPEGYVEMAWIMGLVKHFEGDQQGSPYVGWVDAKSNQPVHEADFAEKYGEYIHEHAGLRFIEPELYDGYDPAKKEFLQEVVVQEDLPVFQATRAVATAFKTKHGDKVSISPAGEDGEEYNVQFKPGARFLVPKAQPFDRLVSGQLPTGWDPKAYGIPADIVSQVDPITLYVLCCVCQAMLSAGIQDPYELYRHIHVSELANCIGTGAGGLIAMRGVYRDRYLDRDVQNDILQESFPNAMDAWANMLLMGAAGPIKSPSGTCATAIESLDTACEGIQAGKVKVALVGGTDDLQEEMSYEFANMKATANTVEELARGRTPKEISRPTASSRAGFVESAGCGVQVLMTAQLALEMGVPIYGIVAYSQMAGDKIGRSVPAPGKGILTAARESTTTSLSPLLDATFRQKQFEEVRTQIQQGAARQLQQARQDGSLSPHLAQVIERAAASQIRQAQNLYGLDLRQQEPGISPIRAALAVWGLTVDDIAVASFHGTSTKANDKNESEVINTMMSHLGRTKGNPVMVVCQKYLTGHPKGAAGAWMLNGGLQILQTGVVPGNRNADNVDSVLQQFDHLVYPAESIQTRGVRAFMLTSFGFGQKGGLVVGVSPRYLFAAVDQTPYEAYRIKALRRCEMANRAFIEGLNTNTLFQAKTSSAWAAEDEMRVFLDPFARVAVDDGSYYFDAKCLHPDSEDTASETSSGVLTAVETPSTPTSEPLIHACQKWVEGAVSTDGTTSVGVDIESVTAINVENEVFLERNYTEAEREYCQAAPDPAHSFAGRWAAKEAVFKSLQVPSKGAGAPLNEIEILSEGGIPTVHLHGEVKKLAEEKQLAKVQVSISHSGELAMAVAATTFGAAEGE
ncbi:fatty acid synthase subunit alpha [Aspergillus awamori]|uniref:Fatty acid synthase subunit alpha n=1 Tax=Aspergillus awamori TaxID=105351 RepID=A0A401KVD6_ASPAW|nr:fatty acid synthase subunit alpha [Aspergillus awamori]